MLTVTQIMEIWQRKWNEENNPLCLRKPLKKKTRSIRRRIKPKPKKK